MSVTVDLDALHKASEELLRSRGVFDVDAFGWLNEHDVDPEFVGYAMWTLSPPYDHDYGSWQDGTPPDRAPTSAEQGLMELGHDFFGLMKTARYFIGLALLHQPAVQPLRVDPVEFEFSEFAALVALTAASDRLRDFIIVATLGTKTNYKEATEIGEAYQRLRASGLGTEADALKEGFKAVGDVRQTRNLAAHGLATQPARVQRQLIAMNRNAFEEQRCGDAKNRTAPYEDLIRELQQQDARELAEIEARAVLLCDCHINLVKLGELSFRTEHCHRNPLARKQLRNP